MIRTIEIRDSSEVYYKGKHIDWLLNGVRTYFGMESDKKYKITIKSGGDYTFEWDASRSDTDGPVYYIYHKNEPVLKGLDQYICCKKFESVFFELDCHKSYSIKVVEVIL